LIDNVPLPVFRKCLQNNSSFFKRQASQQLALWVEITIRKLPSFAVRLGKEKYLKILEGGIHGYKKAKPVNQKHIIKETKSIF